MNAKQIAERLREQAAEIAAEGHAGWGNTMTEAADMLERMAWVPVRERLPEPGQYVICAYPDWVRAFLERRSTCGVSDQFIVRQLLLPSGQRWADEGVTHWKPLPDPPGE